MKTKPLSLLFFLSLLCLLVLSITFRMSLVHFNKYVSITLFFVCTLAVAVTAYFLDKEVVRNKNHSERSRQQKTKQIQKLLRQSLKTVIKKINRKVFFIWKKQKELYNLHWLLLLGLEKSGKIELVNALNPIDLNAELQLDSVASQSQYGSQWYLTNRAICIDVSEKLFLQNPDDAEVDTQRLWHSLLNLLKRYRRKKPINGIVLTINIAHFQSLTEDEVKQFGQLIYQRVHEVYNTFNRILPVHLLFSGCDTLHGYEEFYSDSTLEEHKNTLGFVIPAGLNNKLQVAFFEYYDLLIENLYNQMYTRLHREESATDANAILVFPLQIIYLKKKLKLLFSQLFRQNQLHSHLFIRTFYLSMTKPQGKVLDFTSHDLANRFGLEIPLEQPQKKNENRLFVIHDFFRRSIISTSDLELLSDHYKQKKQTLRILGYTTALILTSVIAWGIENSYVKNRSRLAELHNILQNYDHGNPLSDQGKPLIDINTILAHMEALEKVSLIYDKNADSTQFHWGLYPGVDIYPKANALYQQALVQKFLPALIEEVYLQLKSDQKTNLREFEDLTAYLMLGNTRRLKPEFITKWFSNLWNKRYSNTDFPAHLRHQLDNLLALSLPDTQLDLSLVEQTRERLRQFTTTEYFYNYIKAYQENKRQKELYLRARSNFNFAQIFGEDANNLFVDSYYSAEGYQSFIRSKKELNQFTELFAWILDNNSNSNFSLSELNSELDKMYFRKYVEAWQKSLSGLHVSPFQDLKTTAAKMAVISDPSASPLLNVLTLISENSNSRDILQNQNSRIMTDSFSTITSLLQKSATDKTLPITTVMVQLKQLDTLLESLVSSQDSQKATFDFVTTFMKTGKQDTFTALLAEANQLPEPMKSWLKQIVEHTWQALLNSTMIYINAQWNSQVRPYYLTAISTKYPFAQNGNQLAIADFNHFFCGKGVFMNFWQAYLSPFISVDSGNLQRKSQLNLSLPVSTAIFAQYQRAIQINQTFCANAQSAQIKFAMSPLSLSSKTAYSQLDLYGDSFIYRHGPITTNHFTWPNDTNVQQASLRLEALSGETRTLTSSGPWAVFKLFDHATKSLYKNNSGEWVFFFDLGNQSVKYSIKTNAMINPIAPQFFKKFRVDASLKEIS